MKFVLDASTLLYDPSSVLHKDVSIPVSVIEEIAKYTHEYSRRGKSAREVAELLDQNKDIEINTLDLWGLLDLGGHELLTNNPMSRILAKTRGVRSSHYKKIKTTIREHPVFEVDGSVIDQVYKEGEAVWQDDITGYATLRSGNQSVLVRITDRHAYNLHSVDSLYGIKPRNREQRFAIDALLDADIRLVAFTGHAGTGKTLLSLAGGLQQVVNEGIYNKLMVSRPIVSMGNDIGYLPGTMQEKMDPWMKPIYDNLDCMHSDPRMRGRRGIEELVHLGYLEIEALTYIRGRSISNQFMLIDEAQNLTPHEMKTILTRVGENTKIVLAGDPFQIDSPTMDEYSNGLSYVVDRMKGDSMFAHVHFSKGERSPLAELAAKRL